MFIKWLILLDYERGNIIEIAEVYTYLVKMR